MSRCDDLPADASTFGEIIAAASAQSEPGKPFDQALTGHLATLTERDILEYHERFDQLHAALYRWDVWAAAYLIGRGCSDDAFIDFRAGIIAQGRTGMALVQFTPRPPRGPVARPAAGAAGRSLGDHRTGQPWVQRAVI